MASDTTPGAESRNGAEPGCTAPAVLERVSFFLAALVTVALLTLLWAVVDDKLDVATIQANYNIDLDQFVAEKSERLQYVVGTLAFPATYLALLLFLRKRRLRWPDGLRKHSYLALPIAVVVLIAALRVAKATSAQDPLYYLWVFKYGAKWARGVAVALAAVAVATWLVSRSDRVVRTRVTAWIDAGMTLLAVGFLVRVSSFYFRDTFYYSVDISGFHFDAYFHPVYRVLTGQIPVVDFEPIYGLYPYLLAPVLRWAGGDPMKVFGAAMAALMLVSLGSIAFVVLRVVKNRTYALLAVLAIAYWNGLYIFSVLDGAYYLQYNPHRILFPMLLIPFCLWLAERKERDGRVGLPGLLGHLLCVAALFWNLDTGVVVALAYLAFRTFMLLCDHDLADRKLHLGILKSAAAFALSVAAFAAIAVAVTWWRTGVLIHPRDLVRTQELFYGLGYYMLRMPLLHPWILLVLLYAVSFQRAVRSIKAVRESPGERPSIQAYLYFLLPIVGMGLFAYYQGRSAINNITTVWWPGILILVLLGDEYRKALPAMEAEAKPRRVAHVAKYAFVMLIIASTASVSVYSAFIKKLPITKNRHYLAGHTEISDVLSLLEVATLSAEERASVALVTDHAAAIYATVGRKTVPRIPATADWFSRADYRRVLDYLRSTKDPVLVDRRSMELLEKWEPQALQGALARFSLVASNAGASCFRPDP